MRVYWPCKCGLYKEKTQDNIKRCQNCEWCISICNNKVRCENTNMMQKYNYDAFRMIRIPDYCSFFKEDEHNGR